MKATINGVTVEGTADEIRALVSPVPGGMVGGAGTPVAPLMGTPTPGDTAGGAGTHVAPQMVAVTPTPGADQFGHLLSMLQTNALGLTQEQQVLLLQQALGLGAAPAPPRVPTGSVAAAPERSGPRPEEKVAKDRLRVPGNVLEYGDYDRTPGDGTRPIAGGVPRGAPAFQGLDPRMLAELAVTAEDPAGAVVPGTGRDRLRDGAGPVRRSTGSTGGRTKNRRRSR